MQEINTENDDHVFKMGIKDKSIFVDGFELASRCSTIGSVMRDVAWADGEYDLSEFTDHQLFSAGVKVLVEIDKLGK